MFPLLIKIGPVPIHTYGFLIAMGFLLGVYIVRRLAIRDKLNVERVVDFAFWCLLVGFIGSRVLFVITRWSYFSADPIAIFRIWEGGLVFLGGPIAVVPFSWWYLKKYRLPFWKVADIILIGLTFNHMFGRLGCLSAGCCYGKPTGTGFGIRLYSELVDPAYHGVLLHPTQLYEASALFLLFLGMLWVQRRKVFDGQVLFTYFMAYPIIRSIIETFRGDLIRGFVIEDVLSTSQFLSILVFLGASIGLYLRLSRLKQVRTA